MSQTINRNELNLICPETGKSLLSIRHPNGGTTIWIEDPDGTVQMFAVKGVSAVGIRSKKSNSDESGTPIRLMIEDEGNGLIQIRKGNEVKHVSFDDL